jgi:PLP dependent protein
VTLADVRARIDAAAAAAGRAPSEITLVVVTKTVSVERIGEATRQGARDLGENRAQELLAKAPQLLSDDVRWHFIGRLQRNKVRALAPFVALWQSVDREELAREVAKHAPGAAVLVQVNVDAEPQKGGCPPLDAPALVDRCGNFGLDVQGLMTVPQAGGDPTPSFRQLRRLTDRLGLPVCSMGMSGDFEAAISEGATMIRVGRAVFGPRPPDSAARR